MRKMRVILTACLPALLVACGSNPEDADTGPVAEAAANVDLQAPSGTYSLDRSHASLLWSVPHMGLSDYTVRFTDFDATLALDAENLENSAIELTIDPLSVSADYPFDYTETHPDSPFSSWNERLAKDEGMMAAGDGSNITFNSTSVEQTGPASADVTGDLTLRGVTKPVTLKVSYNGSMASHPMRKVPAIGFNAEGTINPSEFGVNMMGGALEDAISVRFSGEFLGEASEAGETAAAE